MFNVRYNAMSEGFVLDSIAVSLFVDNFVVFDKIESEANPNSNLIMRRASA